MRHYLLPLFTLLFFVFPTFAQDETIPSTDDPYPCPYTDGAYYQPGVFPRYDAATSSLVLVNGDGAIVQTLEAIEQNVRIINWSPDCRYLTGVVGVIRWWYYESEGIDGIVWSQKDIVFWDTVTSTRVHSQLHQTRRLSGRDAVIWRSDSAYALILGPCSGWGCIYRRIHEDYIWNPSTNTSYRVGLLPEGQLYPGSRADFNQYYWDYARNWIWGSGPGAVTAYDINTGAEVRVFPVTQNPSSIETRFRFSSDGSLVITYSSAQSGYNGEGGITIYNIDTQEPIYVNAEGFAAPEISFADYHPVALSDDNRYLIAGYDAIRVWDLWNLPENYEDRLPIFRHGGPEELIWSVRFSEPGVIETTSAEGTQRWDLLTGAFISAD